MDGNNLNAILKTDPSLGDGHWYKVYERSCPVEMKIVEASILRMVGHDIASTESLNFKVLVRGREAATPRKAQSYDLGKVTLEKGEEVSER